MTTPLEMAREIVAREGGYVNDPDDPGGATKFGVTIHTMRRLRLDLTGDGAVTEADVRRLSQEDAVRIFLDQYFRAPRIDELPEPLQATVFDMQVNAGATAVRLLQKLLASFGTRVVADGIIGPKTLAAVRAVHQKAGRFLVDAYGIERRNYYLRLADSRPALRKFARTRAGGKGGWIKRAEEFIAPEFHMSDNDFRERVSTWA